MSLQVWLPLTKDLTQQGLNNITVINNGVTYSSTGGKLGGCYQFSGSSQYLSFTQKIINTTTFSISFWIYPSNVSGNKCIVCCRNATNKSFAIYMIGAVLRIDTGTNWSTGYSLTANTWYHIVFTSNGTTQCLYSNGSLIATRTAATDVTTITSLFTIGSEHTNGSSFGVYFAGKLNDIRIYNNCLSAGEVKEISKGLILHYPLNNKGFGQENLILNSNVEKSGKNTIITYDLSTEGITVVKGATMRISADIKSDIANSIIDCYVRSSSSNSMCANTIFTGIGTTYQRYTMTTICNQNQDKTPQWFAFRCNGSNGTTTTATFTIKNVKLELGEITTPWCPASSDTIYSTLNLNGITEYDISGYQYNGIRTGTFTYNSDTPKYWVNTGINAATGIKKSNFYIGDVWTLSFWFKYPSLDNTGWKSLVILNSTGGDADIQLGNYLNCNSGAVQYSVNGKYTTGVTASFGIWHHVVGTYDGTTLRCYLDGVQKTTVTPGQTLSRSNLGIGCRCTASDFSSIGSGFSNGFLSDVRIYATALSADDVAKLYSERKNR